MSKIGKMIKAESLSRDELLGLLLEIQEILNDQRPFYVKETLKTCGKEGCTCLEDPPWLHGPYLYVHYVDTITGKRVQRSIGKLHSEEDFWEWLEAPEPHWTDEKYIVPHSRSKSKTEGQCYSHGWAEIKLNFWQFENLYGVHPDDDKFGRPSTVWVKYASFERDHNDWKQRQEIAKSPWAKIGVGTLKGIRLLDDLTARGYYYKD